MVRNPSLGTLQVTFKFQFPVIQLYVPGLWDFMTKLHTLVGNLQQHLQKSQDNIGEIKNVLIPYARKPLFERKDGRRDTVLCVEEREERTAKRYSEMGKIAKQIENLLQQNMQLFEMEDKQSDPKWVKYIEFVDGIALNYLFQTVGCRYNINTCSV